VTHKDLVAYMRALDREERAYWRKMERRMLAFARWIR
jgi:hypothetical protein